MVRLYTASQARLDTTLRADSSVLTPSDPPGTINSACEMVRLSGNRRTATPARLFVKLSAFSGRMLHHSCADINKAATNLTSPNSPRPTLLTNAHTQQTSMRKQGAQAGSDHPHCQPHDTPPQVLPQHASQPTLRQVAVCRDVVRAAFECFIITRKESIPYDTGENVLNE